VAARVLLAHVFPVALLAAAAALATASGDGADVGVGCRVVVDVVVGVVRVQQEIGVGCVPPGFLGGGGGGDVFSLAVGLVWDCFM